MPHPLLTVEDVSKTYDGFKAISNLNFYLYEGELRTVIGPNLVPREDISTAISVGSVIFGSSMFIGPAVSGLLIEHFGPACTFTVNAIAYGAMYMCLLNIKLLREEAHRGSGSLLLDTIEGVKFVAGHHGIRAVMLMAFIISICIRPMIDLMPGFADAVYHRPTEGLATLMSAFGIGAMIASNLLMGNALRPIASLVKTWKEFVHARHAAQQVGQTGSVGPGPSPSSPQEGLGQPGPQNQQGQQGLVAATVAVKQTPKDLLVDM